VLCAYSELFELQSGVGNYQTITNTYAVTNNPTISENKGRYYFHSSKKHTLFSQKNEVQV